MSGLSPWLLVLAAGVLEVVWAVGLKYSQGFTRPVPTAITVAGALASFWLLSRAMQALPVGTAYAVWVGIGAVGTAALGMMLFAEPVNPVRLAGIALVVAGIAALRMA